MISTVVAIDPNESPISCKMNVVVVGLTFFLLPLLGSTQFLDMACGIRAHSPSVPRVKNGTVASLTSSPWMAFLHSTDGRFICGGSLITNRR